MLAGTYCSVRQWLSTGHAGHKRGATSAKSHVVMHFRSLVAFIPVLCDAIYRTYWLYSPLYQVKARRCDGLQQEQGCLSLSARQVLSFCCFSTSSKDTLQATSS